MITQIAHLCFTVADLDASIAFYCDALGCGHGFDFINDEGKRFGVYLHVGGRNFIELFEGDPKPTPSDVTYRHFCLEVDDLKSAVETLRQRGVDVTDPKLGSDKSWQAWLADPDGNRIELHEYTPESRQNDALKG